MRIACILTFVLICTNVNASIEKKIIKKFNKIENLSFNFTQTVGGKDETGNCIIKYPKKIFCKYNYRFNKILVSNGKSLVIKSDKNKQYYLYPLERTPLVYLLNKKLILEKISKLRSERLNDKFLMFSISQEQQKINIFFSNESLDLVGWQTEDIYQNLSVTYIYDLKINKEINEKVFELPKPY